MDCYNIEQIISKLHMTKHSLVQESLCVFAEVVVVIVFSLQEVSPAKQQPSTSWRQ